MLTQDDLTAIGNLIDQRLEVKFKPIRSDIGSLKSDVNTLKEDVGSLKSDVITLKEDMGQVKSDIKTMQKDLRKVKKDVDIVVDHFDSNYLNQEDRITRIEERLHLSSS